MKYIIGFFTGVYSLLQGLTITLKNMLTPAMTLQYPKKKMAMTERYRGLVDLRPEKCIMCYQCVKICPTGCLALKHKESPEKKKLLDSFTYNMELCCFCGMCEQVCPTSAIYMNKIYEIAAYTHDDLHRDLLDNDKYAKWLNPPVK